MRIVTRQKDPLPDTAHRSALLVGPIRSVTETVVVGDVRLERIIDDRHIHLAVRPRSNRDRRPPPGKVARPSWRMKLDRGDALGRDPEVSPSGREHLEKPGAQIVDIAKVVERGLIAV